MAQYKVPQDVEADDKLIGPFSFRQFVYLLVAAGLIALAVGMFQLFPLLAIIPLPFAFFFLLTFTLFLIDFSSLLPAQYRPGVCFIYIC